MSHIVMLDLPENLAERAQAIAAQTNRRMEDVLLDWIGRAAEDVPVEELPDDQVLALSELMMSQEQQDELSELLAQQREGALDETGRYRLDELVTIYRQGMLRKAQALKVAVERGLRPGLDAVS